MKKLAKIYINLILNIISRLSSKVEMYHKNWNMFNSLSLGVILINYFFQRILRINSEVDIPVNFTSKVSGYKNIKISKDRTTGISFATSGGCYIQAINGIEIGERFLFAPGLKLISANHDYIEHEKFIKTEPISIGSDVWAGSNVTILPGIKIGDNCIIGAGSIVTKNFPESNLIIAGNPAKIIGYKKMEY